MSPDDKRRRRALYRAQHRGTKEMDFLLGRYAEARLPAMVAADITTFEELLALPDPELQGWLMHGQPFGGSSLTGLLRDIQAFHGIGEKPH
jgi:antitoxin CptB